MTLTALCSHSSSDELELYADSCGLSHVHTPDMHVQEKLGGSLLKSIEAMCFSIGATMPPQSTNPAGENIRKRKAEPTLEKKLELYADSCGLSHVHTPDMHVQEKLGSSLLKSIEAMCFSIGATMPPQSTNPAGENIRKRKAEPTLEKNWQSKISKTLSSTNVHSENTASIPEPNITPPPTFNASQEQGPNNLEENSPSALSSSNSSNDGTQQSELLSLLSENRWSMPISTNSPVFKLSHSHSITLSVPPPPLNLTQLEMLANPLRRISPQPPATTLPTFFLLKKAAQILHKPTKMKQVIESIYQEADCSAPVPSSISEMLFLMHRALPSDRKYDNTRFCIKYLAELCTFLLVRPPLDPELLAEVQDQYHDTLTPNSRSSRSYQKALLLRTENKLTYALQTLRANLPPDSQSLKQILQTLSINNKCAFKALEQCSNLLALPTSQKLDDQCVTNPATALCQPLQVKFCLIIQTLQRAERIKIANPIETLYSHSGSEDMEEYCRFFRQNSSHAPEIHAPEPLDQDLQSTDAATYMHSKDTLLEGAAKIPDLSASSLLSEEIWDLPSTNSPTLNLSHSAPAALITPPPLTCLETLSQLPPPECPRPRITTLTTLFLKTKAEQILQNPTEMESLVHSIYHTAELSDPAPSSITEMIRSILTKIPPIRKNDDPRFCIQAITEICIFLLSHPSLDSQLLSEVRKVYILRSFPHLKQRSQPYKDIFFIRTTTKLTYALQTLRDHLTPTNQPLTNILKTLEINDSDAYKALEQCAGFLQNKTSHLQLQVPCFVNPATNLCQSSHQKPESLLRILQDLEKYPSYSTSYLDASGPSPSITPDVLYTKTKYIIQHPTEMQKEIYRIYQGCRLPSPAPVSEMLLLIREETPSERKYDDTRFCIHTLAETCTFLLARPPLDPQLLNEIRSQYCTTSFPKSRKRSQIYKKMFFLRTEIKLTYALQTLRKNLTPDNQPLTKILKTLEIADDCACKALEQCTDLLQDPNSHPQLKDPLATDDATELCLSPKVQFSLIIKLLKNAESQNSRL